MPDRQKYTIRMAICPQNAMEGTTYMDLAAVQAEIAKALGEYTFAVFDCINDDDSVVKVLVKAADIQMVMHTPFRRTLGAKSPLVQ